MEQRRRPGDEEDADELQGSASDAIDPYDADSDHEYAPLEAERATEEDVIKQALEFEDVDATLFPDTGDENVETAAPGRAVIRERLEDLDEALDESEDGDPESLSMREARRNSTEPPDELQEPLERMMDRTPLRPEDLDTESMIDATDGFGGREER